MGQVTGDFSQKNTIDKITLDNVDLSAKNKTQKDTTQKDDTQEDIDPMDFIVSNHSLYTYSILLANSCAFKQLSFVVNTRYSIKTKAPPRFIFA